MHSEAYRRVKLFDLVHITIFVLAMFYVANVIISFLIVRLTWRKWTRYETKHTHEDVLQEYAAMQHSMRSTNCCLRILNLVQLYRYSVIVDKVNYFSTRAQFIKSNSLKADFRHVYNYS